MTELDPNGQLAISEPRQRECERCHEINADSLMREMGLPLTACGVCGWWFCGYHIEEGGVCERCAVGGQAR